MADRRRRYRNASAAAAGSSGARLRDAALRDAARARFRSSRDDRRDERAAEGRTKIHGVVLKPPDAPAHRRRASASMARRLALAFARWAPAQRLQARAQQRIEQRAGAAA